MVRNRSIVKREAAEQATLEPGFFLEVYIVAQLVARIVALAGEPTGLTASEQAIHSSIGVLGSVTPTELSRRLGVAATTLSATIRQLVERGEIRRVRNPNDGRSYVLQPTARGRRTHERTALGRTAASERVRARLGPDADDVLAALRRLEEALRAELADSP